MKSFLWIIDALLYDNLKSNGGVASSYILPFSNIQLAQAENLTGSYVWIILRNKVKDFLFARLFINRVEKFNDGLNKDDYLLTINNIYSLRIISDNYSFERWQIEQTTTYPYGISEINSEFDLKLLLLLIKSISFKFKQPLNLILHNFYMPPLVGSLQHQAKLAIKSVIINLSLNEIWTCRLPKMLNPFANFAYYKIKIEYTKQKADELLPLLQIHDPISAIQNLLESRDSTEPDFRKLGASSIPDIDIELVPIIPHQVFARQLIGKTSQETDYAKIMEKTELAEKRHQDILRDFSTFLISKRLFPKQSLSIDLALDDNDSISVFEIKTANESNIFQQTSKGLFQLLCYREKLIRCNFSIKHTVLILTKLSDSTSETFISNLLAPLGITTLIYNDKFAWPDRLFGLSRLKLF
jgi:hypothetical protein